MRISADNGTIALLGFRGPGDLLGEIDRQPSPHTITTVQNTSVRQIPARELLAFLQLHPEGTTALFQVITERLRRADQRRLDLTAYPAVVRLARILIELAEDYGTQKGEELRIGIPLSQPDLASLAGLSLPTVEKALSRLSSRNILTTRYRSVAIQDMEALCKFAEYPHA